MCKFRTSCRCNGDDDRKVYKRSICRGERSAVILHHEFGFSLASSLNIKEIHEVREVRGTRATMEIPTAQPPAAEK